MVRRDRRVRSLATGASLLVVALVFAIAPATADASLGDITSVAGGIPAGPVAATSVGQVPASVAAASFGGHSYLYVADATNDVVSRIDAGTGQQVLIAGLGVSGFSGDGGLATSAGLDRPSAVAVDQGGAVAIAGGDRIRYIPPVSGTFFGQAMTAGHIYTIAGTGTAGYTGDGGPATSAQINDGPQFFLPGGGIAFDPGGNLAIADSLNNVVRFVARQTASAFGQSRTAGDIYTVVGTGTAGSTGDGGVPTNAELKMPLGVAFDSSGDLAIADTQNERIRFVLQQASGGYYGQPMTAGDIYTIAGSGTAGSNCSGGGISATSLNLSLPVDVSFDSGGDFAIADTNNQCVRFVPASGGNFYGQVMTGNDMYTIAGDGSGGFSGDGGAATGAQLNSPVAVSLDASGRLAIADFNNDRVRLEPVLSGSQFGQSMSADDIYTVAGNGSGGFSGDNLAATGTELFVPTGVAVAPGGGFAIGDFGNSRIRFVAGSSGTVLGQAMTGGNMYTIAGNGSETFGGDGGLATSAQVNEPEGARFDQHGDLVIADRFNHRVRFVPAVSGTYFGQSMTANDIYTIAGNGTGAFAGDGGPASSAELQEPSGVFIDSAGDLVIADTSNHRVRFVPAVSGTYFGQSMTAGDIYTIAGNGTAGFNADGVPGPSSELNYPEDVVEDPSGNLLIADGSNNRLRLLAASSGTYFGQSVTAGDIYTIAGVGTAGSSGDGGSPAAAQLSFPEGVATDAIGDVAIADSGDARVRFIPARSGVYFGPSMTAGDIYTIAGNGTAAFAGDGGPATSAELKFPAAVAFDLAGDVLIADSGNNRIRMVSGTVPALSGGGTTGGGAGGAGGTPGTGGTGGTGGTPGTPTARAKVTKVTLRGTKVLVTINCAGTAKANCSTALKLTVTETIRGTKVIAVTAAKHKRPKTRKKIVIVGSATLMLHGGQRKTVTITLNGVGRRLLAPRRRLQVTLTVTQGRTVLYRHKLTLTKPKRKPKQRRR